MENKCKRCLLLEAGMESSYNTVKEYISTLDETLKVDDTEYSRRLKLCKSCDNLISGMCLKCGCYAEMRAILVNKTCADADNTKW